MLHLNGPGQIEISFKFARHLGPRFIHGAVTLQFDGSRPYSFMSKVKWPSGCNFEEAIRFEVESVLRELQGDLNKTSVTLKEIEWDEVASVEFGFRQAARQATLAAFDVGVKRANSL